MSRRKRPYFRQRPALYFDENFPLAAFDVLAASSYWRKKFKFVSAARVGHLGKPDEFHFAYCRREGHTLVTLDADFANDAQYPFNKMPGVIIIKDCQGDADRIRHTLERLLDFISAMPLPKTFMGDSKFVASGEGCVMRGRDAKTREIKSLEVVAGRTLLREVREFFNY
jgi:predicted nuclease of predicted toxin-antitoxin system